MESENVLFQYSTGDCSTGEAGWDAPSGVVTLITVHLKPKTRLSQLDITGFVKSPSSDRDSEEYENKEDGVTFEVSVGIVTSLIYGPSAKDLYFRCPKEDMIFGREIPGEMRTGLFETLKAFTDYVKGGQFEDLYSLYLPDFAAEICGASDKHEFAAVARGSILEPIVGFDLDTAMVQFDHGRFGKTYAILGYAKILRGGETVDIYMRTYAVIRKGKWYFVDFFWPLPK